MKEETWYEHCGYATLKEYNEALMERITAVANYIAHEEKRGKSFEIVPPGFYPKTNMTIVPPGILVPNF